MKKITYVHDFCFKKNGQDVYTAVGMPESYFDRFFEANYESVSIISRNIDGDLSSILSSGFQRIKSKSIILPVSIRNYFQLLSPFRMFSLCKVIRETDLLVINFPSLIGLFIWFVNLFIGKPYTLEVAADYDQFYDKKFGWLPTFIFKKIFSTVVSKSIGCIFVSSFLATKYKHSNSIVASNVNISCVDEGEVKCISENTGTLSILLVGGVNKRKGVDVAIKASKIFEDSTGVSVTLDIAGGHFDDDYLSMANEINFNGLNLHGVLSKDELAVLYKNTDIYIQPSRAEGIPRATIEAMSYGNPVAATDLPGFGEILDSRCLTRVGSDEQLSNIIQMLRSDSNFYYSMSVKNKNVARNFLYSTLQKKRVDFYLNLEEVINARI
ncbi:Gt5 [Vibrio crassostreae]|nr:Gt5 [Vibrio crassostreae]CAK2951778.1 Gt5 [Vibrio crassostreae]CAK2952880.1 Gt5 [Vibrio crassostreae]CAK2953385.1 Gt5 [Vibrio crassostreae]CAK2955270.1 Gt5 [Vibrio crassostreae]